MIAPEMMRQIFERFLITITDRPPFRRPLPWRANFRIEVHIGCSCVHEAVHQEAGDQNGAQHGDDHAQQQGLGEALDGAGTEDQQHDGGDQGGYVGVEHGGHGVLETGPHGSLGAAALARFLVKAFEDNDVGVHSHTDAQHHAGQTRQGQLDVEQRDQQEEDDNIQRQRPGSDEAVQPVAEDHQQHDQHDADQGRFHGRGESVLSQGGGNLIHLLLSQLQGQCAGLDLGSGGQGLFLRVAAGDDTAAVGDGGLHGGVDQHFVIQGNLDIFAHVLEVASAKRLRPSSVSSKAITCLPS